MNSGMDSAYGHASAGSSPSSPALAFPEACAYPRTWSRPASLARYSATSAAASNSNRSSPCWPSTATPIETVTLMRAAAAARLVGLADLLSELSGQRADYLVSDQVAVAVVDPFEVIDVDQQQGQRCVRALGPRDLSVGLALPGGGVQQPRLP